MNKQREPSDHDALDDLGEPSELSPTSARATLRSLGGAALVGWTTFALIDAAFRPRPISVTIEATVAATCIAAMYGAEKRWLSPQRAARAIAAATAAGLVVGSWHSGGKDAIGWWFLACVPLFIAHVCSSRESALWSVIAVLATVAAVSNPFGVRFEFVPTAIDKTLGGAALIAICALLAWLARQRMDRALEKLARVSRARSDLLASISHEIRTPLHGILGLATVLDEADLSAEQRELVRALKSSGRALNRIVDDVLDMARVDAGMVSITPRPADLFAVVEDVIDLFAADAASKNITLVTLVEGVEHFCVQADEDRFRQVLSNLVRNALKFTEEGSVIVRASASPVEGGSTITVRVEDTGPGLTDAQIDQLFERFAQPNAELARAHGGAGLGLALARDFVTRMGGALRAERGRAKGACFIVELSLPRAHVPPVPAREASVLVLEADPLVADAARSIAEHSGGHVRVATSVREAIEVSEAHRFDTVIIGQSAALDAVSALNELQSTARLPRHFIAATSTSVRSHTRAADQFDRVILRPVRRSRLADAATVLPHTPTPHGSANARRARALIVDDDATNRRLLSRMLDARGWKCTTSERGATALEALDTQPFEVVLCDLHMSNMNGIALLREARARGHTVPFVVVTASVLEQDRRDCEEAGFDHFLRKPFEPEELDAILVAIVGTEPAPPRPRSVAPPSAEPAPAPSLTPPATQSEQARAQEQPLLSEDKFAALADFLGPELHLAAGEFIAEAARYVDVLCDPAQSDEDRRRAVHNLGSSALAMGLMAVGSEARALEARWASADTSDQLTSGEAIRSLFLRSRAELEAIVARRRPPV